MPAPSPAPADPPLAGFGRFVSRLRYVVLVAVVAVLLVAVTLFLVGAMHAVRLVFDAWRDALSFGEVDAKDTAVEFLGIISVMLRAVVFYIIGTGLYSLFITPLNLSAALGVESLLDLETKVVSVVVVILAVSFLEHFVRWEKPDETLRFAAALALVVAALVAFQFNNHRAKEFAKTHRPDEQKRAQSELFHEKKEEREIPESDIQRPA